MRQGISKVGQCVIPAVCALALGACFHPAPPDGSLAPAGAYGGTVVAYPVGYGYGFPYDYGYSGYGSFGGGYLYSPYGYGPAYGYAPYSYPYASVYSPVYLYRTPRRGRIDASQNGQYGLRPWGATHRVAIPRPPIARGPIGAFLQHRQAHSAPMTFQLPPLRPSSATARPRPVASPPRPQPPPEPRPAQPQRQKPSRRS